MVAGSRTLAAHVRQRRAVDPSVVTSRASVLINGGGEPIGTRGQVSQGWRFEPGTATTGSPCPATASRSRMKTATNWSAAYTWPTSRSPEHALALQREPSRPNGMQSTPACPSRISSAALSAHLGWILHITGRSASRCRDAPLGAPGAVRALLSRPGRCDDGTQEPQERLMHFRSCRCRGCVQVCGQSCADDRAHDGK